jgi:hypothetical protein
VLVCLLYVLTRTPLIMSMVFARICSANGPYSDSGSSKYIPSGPITPPGWHANLLLPLQRLEKLTVRLELLIRAAQKIGSIRESELYFNRVSALHDNHQTFIRPGKILNMLNPCMIPKEELKGSKAFHIQHARTLTRAARKNPRSQHCLSCAASK